MYKIHSKGFTLIELLVVIGIIGILSAVVLASLNTARTKGNDAAIQTDLGTVRTEAEIQYATLNNSYNTTATQPLTSADCSALTTAGTLMADIAIQNATKGAKTANGGTGLDCGISSTAYSFASVLATGGAWCIDSTGISRKFKADGTTAYSGLTGTDGAHAASGGTVCQ